MISRPLQDHVLDIWQFLLWDVFKIDIEKEKKSFCKITLFYSFVVVGVYFSILFCECLAPSRVADYDKLTYD